MSEERKAIVHDDELSAIKDSRQRDMPIFQVATKTNGDSRWVVATTEHQAQLALVEHLWPMEKLSKRERDERYLQLLEGRLKVPEAFKGKVDRAELDVEKPLPF